MVKELNGNIIAAVIVIMVLVFEHGDESFYASWSFDTLLFLNDIFNSLQSWYGSKFSCNDGFAFGYGNVN
jgi:hypothetical protein